MNKTVLVKIKVQESDKSRIQATFSDYKVAWQAVFDYVFKEKCYNRSKVHFATYQVVRKTLPNLSSALVQEARNDAISKAKSTKTNRHKITKPPILKRISIRFDKRTASIKGNVISFVANQSKRIKAKLIDFPFLSQHRGFKMLAPMIFCKKGQYWAALVFEIPESIVRDSSIIGVDMGLRILAATSEGKLIRGTKLNLLRRKTRFLKKVLQRKDTKSAKRHLKRISRLEKRQSRDVIHCAVNEVLNTKASIIAIEDLDLRARKYRKSANRRRFAVPISEFTRILEYKAKLQGKQVVKVKPAYTSQNDCRGLNPGKRIGGKYIGLDGKILHSDINAACNIALKAKNLGLNNPVSIYYANRQVTVNSPTVGGSHLQASIPLG